MASMFTEPYSLAAIGVRSFVLLLLTASIAFAVRRRSAAVLHGIWAVGLGGCLATPIVMLLSPSWNLPLLPPKTNGVSAKPALQIVKQPPVTTGIATNAPIRIEETMASQPLEIDMTPTAASDDSKTDAQTKQAAKNGPIEWLLLSRVALSIWVIVLLAILLRLLRPMISMQRTLRQANDLDDVDWCKQRDIAAQLLGLRANVALKRHTTAISPMVVGLYRPVVLLPDDADTWSGKRRHLVLLHELAHVQRRDVFTQTMATVACAVYWFNPLAWWGANEMKRLREIACDDAVVTNSGVPATYARTLLDVAKRYRC